MAIIDWILAKKDGQTLSGEALDAIVAGFTSGAIPDYQMSALLMAITIRGMGMGETIALTRAMAASGETLNLDAIAGVKLDKHSSGGVGDKVTLALVPIVAAAGVPMAKMSGHGLGYTGGTLDKLESIPGYRAELSSGKIIAQVRKIGACICAQTDALAPADRAIYALRDVTGTVASIPLIASSIMSKKIACGADAIVLDIKVGSGAFMKTKADALELADTIQQIGAAFGKRVACFLTDMNQPLGRAVGNALEIEETLALLCGEAVDARLYELTLALCRAALNLADNNADPEEIIASGAALKKLEEIVMAQGAEAGWPECINSNRAQRVVRSESSGYVTAVDALRVAEVASALGAGRRKKGDAIDYQAGIWLNKVVGDSVSLGEELCMLYASDSSRMTADIERDIASAFAFGEQPPQREPIILAQRAPL